MIIKPICLASMVVLVFSATLQEIPTAHKEQELQQEQRILTAIPKNTYPVRFGYVDRIF